MSDRRSLKGPVTLGVLMIVLVVVLAAGWISITVLLERERDVPAVIFWAILGVGGGLLICVLLGVIAYLTLSVKSVNLARRQSNFIDSVTHELKSPIASLKLYLQTLSIRPVSKQERADFHRFMLEDVERLDQLINHLLDVARIDRGAMPENEESFRLDEMLRQCSEAVCLRYRVPLSTIQLDIPPTVITTKEGHLEILFRNLVDNAVKYGGIPPEVQIVSRPSGPQQITVSVIDNGPGIPPELRRKVFGRFVRLGNELERSKPGTGLGLHLVRNIVRSLRGTVHVHSRKDTPGTEFEVVLSNVSVTDLREEDHQTASLTHQSLSQRRSYQDSRGSHPLEDRSDSSDEDPITEPQ